MQNPIALHKLMILYMLKNVRSPLNAGILSDYLVANGYTNYFKFQSALGDLVESGMVDKKQTYNSVFYTITEEGANALSLFVGDISQSIQKEMRDYLQEKQVEIKDRFSYFSDYSGVPGGGYKVTCKLFEENRSIFEVNLFVTTEEDARQMCDHWKEKSDEIFAYAFKELS